jgi:hypothetical protein
MSNFIARAAHDFAILISVPGKIRRLGLQFLHSFPDIIDLDLTLLVPP